MQNKTTTGNDYKNLSTMIDIDIADCASYEGNRIPAGDSRIQPPYIQAGRKRKAN